MRIEQILLLAMALTKRDHFNELRESAFKKDVYLQKHDASDSNWTFISVCHPLLVGLPMKAIATKRTIDVWQLLTTFLSTLI